MNWLMESMHEKEEANKVLEAKIKQALEQGTQDAAKVAQATKRMHQSPEDSRYDMETRMKKLEEQNLVFNAPPQPYPCFPSPYGIDYQPVVPLTLDRTSIPMGQFDLCECWSSGHITVYCPKHDPGGNGSVKLTPPINVSGLADPAPASAPSLQQQIKELKDLVTDLHKKIETLTEKLVG